MGRRIGRAKACAAYRRVVTAARFLAAIISNLARASRTLVLRALFGASKSCALVNLFMDLPPMGELLGLDPSQEGLFSSSIAAHPERLKRCTAVRSRAAAGGEVRRH
jgi:hypothetical protein